MDSPGISSTPTPSTSVSTPTPSTSVSTPTPSTSVSTSTPSTSVSTPTPSTSVSTPTPSTSVSTPTPSTPVSILSSAASVRMSTTASCSEQGFSFDQLYSRGKVYVFPRLFETKADVLKDTEEDMPFDPVQPMEEKLRKAKVLDEEKLENTRDRLKGEKAEFWVVEQVRSHLEATAEGDNAPSFVLHNVPIEDSEIDVLVLDRKCRVAVMEVKATENAKASSRLERAASQLVKAREQVRERLKGLIRPDGVTAVMALPNLKVKDTVIRKRIKALRENPDVKVVVGREAAVYRKLLEGLTSRGDCDVWVPSSPHVDRPDSTFKMAATEFLTVERVACPEEKLGESHRLWLLTPPQMEVRDHKSKLLHVWGPPGAGKTLLLLHRARRWLREGKAVVVTSGSKDFDLLMAQLGRAVMREQEEVESRLRICRKHSEVDEAVAQLQSQHPSAKICCIMDELNDISAFKQLLSVVGSGKVRYSWSADSVDFLKMEDEATNSSLSEQARALGWTSVELSESIRCPENIVELLNVLTKDSSQQENKPIKNFSVPRPRVFQKWSVIDHARHQLGVPRSADQKPSLEGELRCGQCRQELTEALQPQHKDWRRWVALCTGKGVVYTLRVLAEWLGELGVPTAVELDHGVLGQADIPAQVLASRLRAQPPPTGEPSTADLVAAWRERVVAGLDEGGTAAVHVAWHRYFRGLEKDGVLLIHWDQEDFEGQQDRRDVTESHRQEWFQAVSRCQGQLVLLLLSPSPARSLLQLPALSRH